MVIRHPPAFIVLWMLVRPVVLPEEGYLWLNKLSYTRTSVQRRVEGLANLVASTKFRPLHRGPLPYIFTLTGVKKIVRYTEDFVPL